MGGSANTDSAVETFHFVVVQVGNGFLVQNQTLFEGLCLHDTTKARKCPSDVGANLAGCLKTPGEHEVHPYVRLETLCRGESCIRPISTFGHFFGF